MRRSYLGLLMADFCNRSSRGSPPAAIYASLALALVLIHRATGVINFAQGEMATFSTYIAWTLTTNHGWTYWPAFAVTLIASFVGGVGDPPGRDPAERAGLGAPRRDRHDRPAARDQRPRDADLVGRGARRAEPVPDPDDRHRRRRDLDPGHRHDRRRARDRGRALGDLPVHEGRPRDARGRRQPGRGPARRRPRHVDARRSAGASPRCSGRSPGCSPRRASSSTRT